jgi:hypothetical protein
LNANTALLPPNANEFDSAARAPVARKASPRM